MRFIYKVVRSSHCGCSEKQLVNFHFLISCSPQSPGCLLFYCTISNHHQPGRSYRAASSQTRDKMTKGGSEKPNVTHEERRDYKIKQETDLQDVIYNRLMNDEP